ncbi:MAG: transcription termination/antitermination factor NusG [Clostridia bacterium]|nr:transcription termination/antitermination factor NusG [Clostridia bacterium]
MDEVTKLEGKWYVIHTYSGYENMVKEKLLKIRDNNNLADYIIDVVIPIEDDIVEKDGKRKVIQRKKFPGYVFLKMVYTDRIWYLVTTTQGVTCFVGPKGEPKPLTADEVKRMHLEKVKLDDLEYKEGDTVRVTMGAFENFIGVVEKINREQEKVRVNVTMFGRQTSVDFDFYQIELI